MILVTGATGPFGKTAIQFLLQKGMQKEQIAAFVRDESKAQDLKDLGIKIKIGNYDDFESMIAAFKEIEKLLFVSGSDIANRSLQHKNVVDAARQASVPYLVYTSFFRKSDEGVSPIGIIGQSHVETEQYIIESGITYTILRNALYTDILPMFLGEHFQQTGIFLPAGNGAVPFTLRSEMAEAAVNVLLGSGHENKIYNALNTTNYTMFDIAKALTNLFGNDIVNVNPTTEIFTQALLKAGLSQEMISGILLWVDAIRIGYFEAEKSDLSFLLGREPADLQKMLSTIYGSK